MTEIFGVPTQALFGQLLIGLINGAFYALLSLGLILFFVTFCVLALAKLLLLCTVPLLWEHRYLRLAVMLGVVTLASVGSHMPARFRYYSVIYDIVNDAKALVQGMMAPTLQQKTLGHAEIREVFEITGLTGDLVPRQRVSVAARRDRPNSSPPMIVAPDREVPGMSAKHWAQPTFSASSQVMSSTLATRTVCSRRSAHRITKPPRMKVVATTSAVNRCALIALPASRPSTMICSAGGSRSRGPTIPAGRSRKARRREGPRG